VAAKILPWVRKHVTVAGRCTLLMEILTNIIIYYIAVLNFPVEVLMKIDSIRRAFLWSGVIKSPEGNVKYIWIWLVVQKSMKA
jgi:hypothetical protein